jgi:hypothetical protein
MRSSKSRVGCWCLVAVMITIGTACNRSGEDNQTPVASEDNPSAVKQATHDAKLGIDRHALDEAIESKDTSTGEIPAPSATTPAEAVTNFLEAVRRGDDGQAEALLSELARKKTREMDLAVAPPGSPTAKFAVGGTDFPYKGTTEIAHVTSSWSDVDSSGDELTDEIVWILRNENSGWRIAGMATKLFEDQPPLILNFEDPEDMVRKQKSAEAEIRRRDTANSAAQGTPAENTQN